MAVMILRLDTPIVCIAFLFLIGSMGLHSLMGGIQTVFNAILYASREFMEIIATIALVTALSKSMSDLGSDRILMAPMKRIMRNPSLTWWILGITMFLFSLFLWPSPSVALIGAIMLPFAVGSGLSPLFAAMAMNLFGHGFALSYDPVIQGAPAVSASSAGIPAADILTEGRPLFLVMGAVTVISAYLLNRKQIVAGWQKAKDQTEEGYQIQVLSQTDAKEPGSPRRAAVILALAVPSAFLADILVMLAFHLSGGDATSNVSGTAVLLMCLGSVLGYGRRSLEKVTFYLTEGFLFAIRIFAPVIVIGAFFFLGGSGITVILGEEYQSGILNDWALWLAGHAPLNQYMAAALQLLVGGLTGLDGLRLFRSSSDRRPRPDLWNSHRASVPVLAALGQIAATLWAAEPSSPGASSRWRLSAG